ncbi:MAG TPA: competence protein ComEC, partial [Pilimelia sp.]|nr:competence protein ComEC [Pilimelia sp.]
MTAADVAPGEPAPRAPDLRLVGVAAGAWSAAAVTLHGGAVRAGWLAAALALAAAALGWRYLAVRPRRWWLGLLTAAAGGAVVGTALTGLRVAERDAAPVVATVAARATATVALVVTDDPRPVGA